MYLVERTRDMLSNQISNCFNTEASLKTFEEAMRSHDNPFWKEAINDEMDSIMDNKI